MWSCLLELNSCPTPTLPPAERAPSLAENWRPPAACTDLTDTPGLHLFSDRGGVAFNTWAASPIKSFKQLNVEKSTYRYWRVVNDQTDFRPFPQWIKVHSSVDQSLNKEKHSFTYEGSISPFQCPSYRTCSKSLFCMWRYCNWLIKPFFPSTYLCKVPPPCLQCVGADSDRSVDFIRFEEINQL